MAQSQSIDDIKKIKKMVLSPSKAHLNEIVRGGGTRATQSQEKKEKDIYATIRTNPVNRSMILPASIKK